METALQRGDTCAGFEIIDVKQLDEFEAIGIWARHKKSGAEVFHLHNDDEENLFSFAFATPSRDSSGVAHILEHSVLCGSERYPLKDAFIRLNQGSLQTFLNAMTFPDKTVYPASSTERRDYFNLMSVYADAVFRPLLAEWTFMQEGHRLEFSKDENGNDVQLIRTGVVYNEMKGNYSSADSIAGDWSYRALFPDTPYAHDSGGDPDCIPKLSWEALRDFHARYYAPSNCRIFLCGNISTEEQLRFLDEQYLSNMEPAKAVPAVPKADPWEEPRSLSVPYPASEGQKSIVLVSWLCADTRDTEEVIALAALSELLLGHDGAPLNRALVESGLGEDMAPATGLEGDLRETVFTVGLRGVHTQHAEKVQTLILDTLKQLVDNGIAEADKEAALLSLEFGHREIRRAGGPFSLVWMRRALRAWMHGSAPWESLLFVPAFDALKKKCSEHDRYFESLIKKYFLDNPHRALVSVDPETGLSERKEAALAAELQRKAAAMSDSEYKGLTEKNLYLQRVQSEANSPEALASIPYISRFDLKPAIDNIPRRHENASGLPVLIHDLFTNGISYLQLAFPVDMLTPEDYRWLPLLSHCIPALGIPGVNYAEFSSRMARTLGGFGAFLHSSTPAPGAVMETEHGCGLIDTRGRDWLVFSLKMLEEKTDTALDLADLLIRSADFSDLGRLENLILEFRNDIDASLAPGGHSYAMSRSSRCFSRSKNIEELWHGLDQLQFLHSIKKEKTARIAVRLSSLRDRIVQTAGAYANITASSEAAEHCLKAVSRKFGSLGAPKSRSVDTYNAFIPEFAASASDQVFSSASMQIGFASLALPAAPYASREQAAELVLAHYLSTGILWEDIRMRGGAYGAFAHPDGLEPVFVLATYRDPKPRRSLEALLEALRSCASTPIDKTELDKAIIGSYSKETRPRTPSQNGTADFLRFLTGIDDKMRSDKLKFLVDIQADELQTTAQRLLSGQKAIARVAIGGKTQANEAAQFLNTSVTDLPV